jgi:hypothetical protein
LFFINLIVVRKIYKVINILFNIILNKVFNKMRIGKQKAKFTILVQNNISKKSKSFVFDNDIKNLDELSELIKILLNNYYKK